MNNRASDKKIILLQEILLYIVIGVLVISLVARYFAPEIVSHLSLGSVILLILAAPIRMVAVAAYFRRSNDNKYRLFSFLVIGIIALTAAIRAVV